MEAKNKEAVIEFYERMFGNRELAVADTHIAEEYVQHNNVGGCRI